MFVIFFLCLVNCNSPPSPSSEAASLANHTPYEVWVSEYRRDPMSIYFPSQISCLSLAGSCVLMASLLSTMGTVLPPPVPWHLTKLRAVHQLDIANQLVLGGAGRQPNAVICGWGCAGTEAAEHWFTEGVVPERNAGPATGLLPLGSWELASGTMPSGNAGLSWTLDCASQRPDTVDCNSVGIEACAQLTAVRVEGANNDLGTEVLHRGSCVYDLDCSMCWHLVRHLDAWLSLSESNGVQCPLSHFTSLRRLKWLI